MQPKRLLESLIYLDRDYIAGAFEAVKGHAPITQITKNQGMSAGTKIPFFDAGLSATETRSFSVSTFGMLLQLLPELERYPDHQVPPVGETEPSRVAWINGELTVFKAIVRGNSKEQEVNGKRTTDPRPVYGVEERTEKYFAVRTARGTLKIALITTPDYFSSGIGSLTKLYETVLKTVSIPVRALVRVYDVTSAFDDWIGVPLVIYERTKDA